MKITPTGFDQLKKSATGMRAVPEAVERAQFRALNTVAERVMVQARRDIGAEMNLTDSYIRQQMKLLKAARGKMFAVIKVRRRHVTLARYGARQLTRSAPRARGDALRGIGARRKQGGVSVAVKRGGRKTLPGGFLLPLRAGKVDGGNGMGLFIREGSRASLAVENAGGQVGEQSGPLFSSRRKATKDGDIRHLYGPSPYQMFTRWKKEKVPDINKMLAEAFRSQLRYELKGSRK